MSSSPNTLYLSTLSWGILEWIYHFLWKPEHDLLHTIFFQFKCIGVKTSKFPMLKVTKPWHSFAAWVLRWQSHMHLTSIISCDWKRAIIKHAVSPMQHAFAWSLLCQEFALFYWSIESHVINVSVLCIYSPTSEHQCFVSAITNTASVVIGYKCFCGHPTFFWVNTLK